MKNKQRLYSIAIASIALILYLILVSSAVSAASVQNSLAKEPHALISNAENNTASVIIESPYTTAFPTNDNFEVRGPVFDGSDINDILSKNDGAIRMDANRFAIFYYDLNKDMSTEYLSIKGTPDTKDNVIGKNSLVYETVIGHVGYEYKDWGKYPVLGLFGYMYIPIKPIDVSKLAKLSVDSDDKYTLKNGEKVDLGQGYALEAKQIDVVGKKVWLEFTKDGEFVDDQIISTDSGDHTWTCKLDKIQGEDNVPVLKVHVNQLSQDAVDRFVQIDGIWLIDYANAIKIESDDEFGKLNNVAISGTTLTISNDDTITLTRGSDVEIGQGMYFKVADIPDNELKFYVYKQIKDPGTYEVRGQVASGDASWDASNFVGFFYDLNDNFSTESLSVSGLNGNLIPRRGLKYETTIKNVEYKYSDRAASWDTYPVICLFEEPYVPLKYTDPSKFTKLLVDSNATYNLSTGDSLVFGLGYTLKVKQIDVGGKRIWLELDKEGQYIDDKIISVDNNSNKTWTYTPNNIKGEDNVPHLKVHVSEVFQREGNNLARIDGRWFIADDFLEIRTGDRFGKLSTFIKGATISMSNDDILTLTRGSDQEIAAGMHFKVADTSGNELKYYPLVKKSIIDHSKVLVANFNANPTRGCTPLFVQFTDLSQNANVWNWNFGDGVTSTEKNPMHTYSVAGTYTASLTVTNENSASQKTTTITVLTPSSSSGVSSSGSSHSISGSSNGGGVGGSPEPASNVQVKELSQAFITNGKPVKFDFPKNATCVVYVSFDSKKTAGKTTTIAEQLKNKSTLVSELNSGEVYKYFNVWIGTGGFAASKNIENPVVCFKVDKSWLQDKNINQASITVSRYSDKKWSQLPVKLLSEDSKYLYFTAETPEFSFFAITGKAVEKEKVVETKPATDAQNPEKNSTAPEVGNKSEQGKLTSMPGFGIGCGIVCLIAVFLYKRK